MDNLMESSSQKDQEIKMMITLQPSDLQELGKSSDKIYDRISFLNSEGVSKIGLRKYYESLAYFSQAQRELEYLASCGNNINRVLITTTLKNKASAYQKLWELNMCSAYMEALLLNLQCYIDSQPTIKINEELTSIESSHFIKFSKIVNRRIFIGLCHLQNAALISQTGDHSAACRASQLSLKHFVFVVHLLSKFERLMTKGKNSEQMEYLQRNTFLSDENERISPEKILKKIQGNFKKIKKNRHFFSFNTDSISSIKIGEVLQINSDTIENADSNIDPNYYISQIGIIYLSIYISCAYFIISTQARLICIEQYQEGHQEDSQQFLLSKNCVLNAISLSSGIFLFETNLLNHFTKSLKLNYQISVDHGESQLSIQSLMMSSEQIKKKNRKNGLREKITERLQNQKEKKSSDVKNTMRKSQTHTEEFRGTVKKANLRSVKNMEKTVQNSPILGHKPMISGKKKDSILQKGSLQKQSSMKTSNFIQNLHSVIPQKSPKSPSPGQKILSSKKKLTKIKSNGMLKSKMVSQKEQKQKTTKVKSRSRKKRDSHYSQANKNKNIVKGLNSPNTKYKITFVRK